MHYLDNTLCCTVIVPTYNRRNLLDQTLSALTAQTLHKDKFEVIVVDDGSSDASYEVALSYSKLLKIKYIWKPDRGFRVAEARNIGIRNASGEIIVFIDCGVLPASNLLEEHMVKHQERASIAVVGYVYCLNDKALEESFYIEESIRSLGVDQYCLQSAHISDRNDARERLYQSCGDDLESLEAPWVSFWTCNASVRADDIRAIQGFDENFVGWGGEDIELAFRLRQVGVSLELTRYAIAVHHPHVVDALARRKEAFVNFRYFARKHNLALTTALMIPAWAGY